MRTMSEQAVDDEPQDCPECHRPRGMALTDDPDVATLERGSVQVTLHAAWVCDNRECVAFVPGLKPAADLHLYEKPAGNAGGS